MSAAPIKQFQFRLAAALRRATKVVRNPADRAHLERWLICAKDRIWDEIIVLKEPTFDLADEIIQFALHARRVAEDLARGRDQYFELKSSERRRLLGLASKAEDLARYFKEIEPYSGVANFWHAFHLPVMPEQEAVTRIEPSDLRVKQLRQIHEREAALLRLRARREPSRTIARRRKTPAHVAFTLLMAEHLREWTRQPHYLSLALMANIAFPKADVTKEAVAKYFESTTRRGRKRQRARQPTL